MKEIDVTLVLSCSYVYIVLVFDKLCMIDKTGKTYTKWRNWAFRRRYNEVGQFKHCCMRSIYVPFSDNLWRQDASERLWWNMETIRSSAKAAGVCDITTELSPTTGYINQLHFKGLETRQKARSIQKCLLQANHILTDVRWNSMKEEQ